MKNYIKSKIIPEGWLRRRLEVQADGLSGNLDKIWPDVRDSSWVGGDREGWERLPYWLDGFIPLAYLTDDADMIARAGGYISAIIDRQEDCGRLCPRDENNNDVWSHILVCKVLALYCEFTESERVQNALYRGMRYFYRALMTGEIRLFDWGRFRWFEAIISLAYLYECFREEWILELAGYLRDNGADYSALTDRWSYSRKEWTFETHIVNIGMMFKYEALTAHLFGEEYTDKAETLWQILERYHGTAVGSFAGDECLAGLDSNRGTELCSIAELMYSCEVLFELTGCSKWGDRLEKLAFNAYPATLSGDMWTHQYVQMVNQIGCVRHDPPFFGTNNGEAHLFGLEPNYGCCTANFSQGFPKLAMNAFLQYDRVIVCPVMLPATYETEIDGAEVTVRCDTEYPFGMSAKYTVTVSSPVNFDIKVRIPKWSRSVTLNGALTDKEDFCIISRKWSGEWSFEIELSDEPHLVERANGLYHVEYGALVFSLPIETRWEMIEYERNGVERKFPYCDYELYPESEWRYSFGSTEFAVKHCCDGDIPIKVTAKLCPVEWETAEGYDHIAAALPKSNKALGDAIECELVPYGFAKLRMTEMPLCE